MNIKELVTNSVKLFSLPDIYIRLKSVLDDPNACVMDMAAVIRQDPGLTARLLRMVNSSFFGFSSKIETVDRAVNLLGTQQIHDLALSTSVTQAFSNATNTVIDLEKFWYASVRCGVAARLLAYRCNILDSERLFVAGLLQDIGHMVMYAGMPEQIVQVIEQAQRDAAPVYVKEHEMLGFDYAEVGAALMENWCLPNSLIETTRFHLHPELAEDYPLETAIVHIAKMLDFAVASGQAIDAIAGSIDPHVWSATGLSAEIIPDVYAESIQKTDQAIGLILPSLKKAS